MIDSPEVLAEAESRLPRLSLDTREPTGMLFRLFGPAASAIARLVGLVTLDSLSALKSLLTAGALLGGLVVSAAMLIKSCSGPDAGQLADQAKHVMSPSPQFESLRSPSWDDDEIVTIVEPDGREMSARWGDIREEWVPKIEPQAPLHFTGIIR